MPEEYGLGGEETSCHIFMGCLDGKELSPTSTLFCGIWVEINPSGGEASCRFSIRCLDGEEATELIVHFYAVLCDLATKPSRLMLSILLVVLPVRRPELNCVILSDAATLLTLDELIEEAIRAVA